MADNTNPQHNEYPVPSQEPPAQPPQPLSGIKPFVNPNGQNQAQQPLQHIPNDQTQPVQHQPIATPPPSHPVTSSPQPTLPPPESEKKRKARDKLKKLRAHKHYGTVRFAILSFIVFLLVFNFQVIYSQILFYLTPKPNNTAQVQTTTTPTKTTTTTTVVVPQAEVVGPENVLIIPKINVRAPIIFTGSLNETDILKALQDGVVHYAGTANPGENGNAVFFGHSSNDWWQPGGYKFVFVLLEKLVPGDTYEIHYQSRRYVYKVTSTRVVTPTDLTVLAQTATPTSTLITCTPPGTSWRRFIVSAEQIQPTPAAAPVEVATTTTSVNNTSNVAVASTQSGNLPGASLSVFGQIQGALSSFFGRFFGSSNSNNQNDTAPQPNTTTPNHLPLVSWGNLLFRL